MKYQVGGTLTKEAPSYVERQADSALYKALKQDEFCYVLNSRQMGKSSLLVRTIHCLRQEGFRCAIINMTLIGNENVTDFQWYNGLIASLWSDFKQPGQSRTERTLAVRFGRKTAGFSNGNKPDLSRSL
jgi:hypothetical protein